MTDKFSDLVRFVSEHQNDDVSRLLLSKSKWPDIDIQTAAFTIEGRRRMEKKVPSWSNLPLLYPNSLCTEQCSSEETAAFKAGIAARILEDSTTRRIADLTGGLGVDDWAFSKNCSEILYNEMNPDLRECVEHNFKELGVKNARFSGGCAERGSIRDLLGDFEPDLIFLDPARRGASGKKVFLLEDCSPDILTLRDEIFGVCRHILLKLSPMADISMAVSRLGNVREVYTVASGGECKELLIWMDRCHSGNYTITAHESGCEITADAGEEAVSEAEFTSAENLYGQILFEPGKAILKAGLFNTVCSRFKLRKLGRSTHLYTTSDTSGLEGLGKLFRIIEVHKLDKRSIKEVGKSYPRTEVTARNIPVSSDELRKKMGVSSGGDTHVFGVRIDLEKANYLLVTSPL